MTAEINHAEYVSRQSKAQKLMQNMDLQALLITDPTNLFYFTGAAYFGEMSYPRPAALLIPHSAEATLLTHDFHLAVPWKGDIRVYPKVGQLPVDMLQDMFFDAGCAKGKIGAELGLDMQTWKARRFGHGSGLHTTEPPYISGEDHTILKPGMILHIEPGCIQKDGVYVQEEQVLVTETGCQVLSHAPWQLSG
ncbi:MAG: aminopeptidase P family N-terminal domain-containing protein [Desulfobacterales bacterium]